METHGLSIAVLDRGWVIAGECKSDEAWLHIEHAQCVRLWGTTKGLGELAECGPQANTKMDPMPDVQAPKKALLFLVKCNPKKWDRCSCGHKHE